MSYKKSKYVNRPTCSVYSKYSNNYIIVKGVVCTCTASMAGIQFESVTVEIFAQSSRGTIAPFQDIYSYLGLFRTVLVLTRSSQLYLTITCFVCIYNLKKVTQNDLVAY